MVSILETLPLEEKKQKTTFADSYSSSAKVFWINGVITDSYLTVPKGTNPDTTNANTITAIKNALKKVNPRLTTADLATITFEKTTLQVGTSVSVTATIAVEDAKTSKNLNILLEPQTDQQKANYIKNKITDTYLNVPAGTNPDTTNTGTIAAIKKVLQTENPRLTAADLATITFSKATLEDYTRVSVTATITVGTATATQVLSVGLLQDDKQKNSNFRTTADENLEWSYWFEDYQESAINAAGRLVVGDAWPSQGYSSVDYDQNNNLIPDNSSTPLATYLNSGIYLYLQVSESNFTIIFIKGDIN